MPGTGLNERMMSACRKLSIVGSILLAFVPTPGFSQRAERPVETTLCELVKSADRLNEKMVRVRALIVMGMESVILYDKACDADARVELEWPGASALARIDPLMLARS